MLVALLVATLVFAGSMQEFLDFNKFITVLTVNNLTMVVSFGGEKMSFCLEAPEGESIRAYFCRDSFSVLSKTFGEWWCVFGRSEELEKEIIKELELKRVDTAAKGNLSDLVFDESPVEELNPDPGEFVRNVSAEQEEDFLSSSGVVNDMFSFERSEREKLQKDLKKSNLEDEVFVEARGSPSPPPPPIPDDDGFSEARVFNSLNDAKPDDQLSATELRQRHNVQNQERAAEAADMDYLNTILGIAVQQNFYTLETTASGSEGEEEVVRHPLLGESDGEEEGDEFKYRNSGGSDDSPLDSSWVYDDFPDYKKEKNAAVWYNSDDGGQLRQSAQLKIFPNHVPLPMGVKKDIAEGDMGVKEYSDGKATTNVSAIVKDVSVCIRLFEGYDWLESYTEGAWDPWWPGKAQGVGERLAKFGLVDDDDDGNEQEDTGEKEEEAPSSGRRRGKVRNVKRNAHKFFEFTAININLRSDTFVEDREVHNLASCLEVKLGDFWCMETITSDIEKKSFHEWRNDTIHPRDDNDGIIMLKMVSFLPEHKFSIDHKLMSNDGRFAMKILPLRCYIDQSVIHFVQDFFDEEKGLRITKKGPEKPLTKDDELMEASQSETFFQSAAVNKCKMKIDYTPIGVDVDELQKGNYAELLNIFPLESMVLDFEALEMKDITGWGNLFGAMCKRWISNIAATQVHKFVGSTPPFNLINNLGGATADLVIIPMEEYRKKRTKTNLIMGIGKGTASFGGKVALETVTTAHKVSKFVANQAVAVVGGIPSVNLNNETVDDSMDEIAESAKRGVREARRNIVRIPDVYEKNKGRAAALVPIAFMHTVAGGAEAVSVSCIALRNKMRPDLKREDRDRRPSFTEG